MKLIDLKTKNKNKYHDIFMFVGNDLRCDLQELLLEEDIYKLNDVQFDLLNQDNWLENIDLDLEKFNKFLDFKHDGVTTLKFLSLEPMGGVMCEHSFEEFDKRWKQGLVDLLIQSFGWNVTKQESVGQ